MFINSAVVFTLLSFCTLTTPIFSPNIVTVNSGDSASFDCYSRDSNVDFLFLAVDSKDTVMIANSLFAGVDPKYANHYQLNSASGVYTLTVMNATPAYAGTYMCEGNTLIEQAELIVLAGNAECVSNGSSIAVCGTEYKMECNVGFSGNFHPAIEFWTVSITQQLRKVPSESSQHTVVSNISQNRLTQRIFAEYSGVRFECKPASKYGDEYRVRSICTSQEILVSCDSPPVKKNANFGTSAGDAPPVEKNANVGASVPPIVLVIPVVVLVIFAFGLGLLMTCPYCHPPRNQVSVQEQPGRIDPPPSTQPNQDLPVNQSLQNNGENSLAENHGDDNSASLINPNSDRGYHDRTHKNSKKQKRKNFSPGNSTMKKETVSLTNDVTDTSPNGRISENNTQQLTEE